MQKFLDDKVTLYGGDNRDVLRGFADNSIDSAVMDPPYALVSIVKRFANSPRNDKTENEANPYGRTGRGFMGKKWDTGETAFAPEFWSEILRVLKPGAHVVAFSGTRTYHRMACAIEDAGFEIRDQLAWMYGTGFPKSHDVAKSAPEFPGWGTGLKPAWEPICLARKPLSEKSVAANMLRWGVGAINIDGCRVASLEAKEGRTRHGGGVPGNATSFELADGVRAPAPAGRHPANVTHDGSAEVVAAFPNGKSGSGAVKRATAAGYRGNALGAESRPEGTLMVSHSDSGSAARFFYSAKADKADRMGSRHPTVKPVDLMQWLCRLVTPAGGVVLDPFAGSGSTGEAAWAEGMRCILIEREAEYIADIAERLRLASAGPMDRKKRAAGEQKPAGPLFEAA